ncbi:MAG: macro domain-containing protein [Holophagales bacterium]|nr:macro domain-containing protein [Holophagales bacterium]
MIEYKQGDLLADNAEAIVNTVNCVGVMGRGIALQFKKWFPDNYVFYETACKRKEVVPGKMLVYETNSLINPRYIINFPTKRHWRGASRIQDIEAGLADLIYIVQARGIDSIAVPPLGCGLGGLEWSAVRHCMESAFAQLTDVNIKIFEPNGALPAEKMACGRSIPDMTSGRAALVSLTKRYLDGLLDPIVTLLEIHKLMYFLQESGEPLCLNYVKHDHGPFALNLSHVLNAVEGYLLSGYADGGDKPDKQIQIVPGADLDANAFLKQQPDTLRRIGRVTELVDGFETRFGMELLATVHWVAKNEAIALPDIVDRAYAWGPQKRKFSRRQIEIAFTRLRGDNWLAAPAEV